MAQAAEVSKRSFRLGPTPVRKSVQTNSDQQKAAPLAPSS